MDMYSEDEIDPVFRAVASHWMKKIRHAKEHRQRAFGDAADECRAFYNGPRDWSDLMCGTEEGGSTGLSKISETIKLTFEVTVNKTFEFVTIFGPAMYSENPVRTVKPRMPVVIPPTFFPDPMVYQALCEQENLRVQEDGLRSVLLEAYLNWTPVEFRLEAESRKAIDEALIAGRGVLWTELYSPPGSQLKVVRSFWDSVNNLVCDPDAQSFDQAQWIARRCIHPTWKVERDFGLRPGSIKGNAESAAQQSDIKGNEDLEYERARGRSNDLLIYWKVYSRMGVGGRLTEMNKNLREPLEMFGDYAFVCVADNVPFPLNLSPDVSNDPSFGDNPEAVWDKTAWPTPFWASDEWPCTVLDFHDIHNSPWPMPHLKAGMGELKFLNWAMSMLMGKIRNTTRDFIAVKKDVGEEIKTALLEGKDLEMLEIEVENGRTINDLVQFLQHPTINGDIWKMIEAVEANFDKRVGLTELMYGEGGATQIRSAQEASLRSQTMNVRPDDMRKQVESWMSRVGAKEALCARWHLSGDDVQLVFGAMGAWAWGQFVTTRDLPHAAHQLEYRIESGSTSRPNKNWEAQTMSTAFTNLAPIFQGTLGQTGDPTPMNNLIAAYTKSIDLDPAQFQIRPGAAQMQMNPQLPPPDDGQAGLGHQTPATTNVPSPG